MFGKFRKFKYILICGLFSLNLQLSPAARECKVAVDNKGMLVLVHSVQHTQPLWLSADTDAKEKSKGKIWKPLIYTAAVGGITYLIYSIRTK